VKQGSNDKRDSRQVKQGKKRSLRQVNQVVADDGIKNGAVDFICQSASSLWGQHKKRICPEKKFEKRENLSSLI